MLIFFTSDISFGGKEIHWIYPYVSLLIPDGLGIKVSISIETEFHVYIAQLDG